MRVKGKILPLAVLVAAAIYLFPMAQEKLAFARARPSAHEIAPDFSLAGMNGKKLRLADYRGKVVLVNFFASWCPPCKMEIPGFQRIYSAYQGRQFAVIGLALDEVSPSFLGKMGVTYPVAAATDPVVSDYGNVSSIPVSFLVGKDGRIIKKVMGLYPEASLKTDVENALSGRI